MVADRVKGGKTGGDVRPVVISDCWGPVIPAARVRRVARDVTRWVDDPGRNGYLCVRRGWRRIARLPPTPFPTTPLRGTGAAEQPRCIADVAATCGRTRCTA